MTTRCAALPGVIFVPLAHSPLADSIWTFKKVTSAKFLFGNFPFQLSSRWVRGNDFANALKAYSLQSKAASTRKCWIARKGSEWGARSFRLGVACPQLPLALEQLGVKRARGQKVTDPGRKAPSPALWVSQSQTVALSHRSSSLDVLDVEGSYRCGVIRRNLGNKKRGTESPRPFISQVCATGITLSLLIIRSL